MKIRLTTSCIYTQTSKNFLWVFLPICKIPIKGVPFTPLQSRKITATLPMASKGANYSYDFFHKGEYFFSFRLLARVVLTMILGSFNHHMAKTLQSYLNGLADLMWSALLQR